MTIMTEGKALIPLIDLTSLNLTDCDRSIESFIEKANSGFENIFPASVCVYPKYANRLKQKLSANIRSCAVSSYFPSSQSPLTLKLQEIQLLNQTNIDEIDIVLPIGEFLDGNDDFVLNELTQIRQATDKTLKLIIESGVLKTKRLIEKATLFGLETGMDFIKTSTGKAGIGAEPDAVAIMAKTIRRFSSETNIQCGLKISGGIKTKASALQFIQLTEDILGSDFINPQTFRIGASSLYDHLISE